MLILVRGHNPSFKWHFSTYDAWFRKFQSLHSGKDFNYYQNSKMTIIIKGDYLKLNQPDQITFGEKWVNKWAGSTVRVLVICCVLQILRSLTKSYEKDHSGHLFWNDGGGHSTHAENDEKVYQTWHFSLEPFGQWHNGGIDSMPPLVNRKFYELSVHLGSSSEVERINDKISLDV